MIIIGAFGLYQAAALHKADADKIVFFEKKIEQLQSGKGSKAKGGKSGGSTYRDGSYEGSAKGFGGNVVVKVTVKNDKIEKIDLVDASKEDGSYLASAKGVIKSILHPPLLLFQQVFVPLEVLPLMFPGDSSRMLLRPLM